MNKTFVGCACVALAGPTGASYAGFIDLSGGWRASWDDSLDGLVEIADSGVFELGGQTVQVIQKVAEFTQPPPLPGLPFPSIQVTFTQLTSDAVSFIAIDEEVLTNSTGVVWTDFHMTIVNHNDAFFDPVRTQASGGGGPIGFSVAPFQQAAFSPDNRELDVWDGRVEPGEVWQPGEGVNGGMLWMSLSTHSGEQGDPFTVFTLKERPTPTPGGLGLALLAGVTACGRRRRAEG